LNITQTELGRIEHEVLQYPEWVQSRYYDMVASGQNPRFALMAACQQAPGTRYTDKTFGVERHQVMNEMKPKMRDKYLQQAKKAGVSTQGKYYVGALGRPNDPSAWVSTVDDAKRVCRDKNLTADGIVRHQGTAPPPKKKPRLAPDIRDQLVQKRLARDGALAERCSRDSRALKALREEVVDRHGRPDTA